MTPEQTQAVEVKASADNAMLKGLTRIQEAAVEAGGPVTKEIKDLDANEVGEAAKGALNEIEKNETAALKTLLNSEKLRQEQEMQQMEAGANMAAQLSADHVRDTTEQWAENQARNYINLQANGSMGDAMRTADKTAAIRQEATELTKSAISSAAQSLVVAKRAQEAIAHVPQDEMKDAKKYAADTRKEQKELNVEIEATESSVRTIAKVAAEGYDVALATLKEANEAEKTAREALETSRSNAEKIEKLKTRAQAVSNKAKKAEEEHKKSLQ